MRIAFKYAPFVIGPFLVTVGLWGVSRPSAAQVCAPYAMVAEMLNAEHAERLAFRGIMPNGMLLEIWVNDDTDTWTAISVQAFDETVGCLLSVGDGGALFTAPLPGDPS